MLARWRWRTRRRPERIDPFGVGEPWRHLVKGALQAQARHQRTVAAMAPGPLRERLDDVGRRIEEGVRECWRIAQQGDALDEAVSGLDLPGTRSRLAAAISNPATGADDPIVASLQAQVDAAERLEGVVAQAEQRLAQLEAGLDQAVATAVALSAPTALPADDISGLGDGVDHLVADLTALRTALDETRALER